MSACRYLQSCLSTWPVREGTQGSPLTYCFFFFFCDYFMILGTCHSLPTPSFTWQIVCLIVIYSCEYPSYESCCDSSFSSFPENQFTGFLFLVCVIFFSFIVPRTIAHLQSTACASSLMFYVPLEAVCCLLRSNFYWLIFNLVLLSMCQVCDKIDLSSSESFGMWSICMPFWECFPIYNFMKKL